ncbi:MAG: T9SS type A sorting domain-containing protein, partial [Bacteroidota bacterium]
HVGVEDLRIDIETAGGNDEAHAWNALKLQRVEDAWVTNCSFLHFGLAGVITHSAARVTVDSCRAVDPVAQVTGARMYNFNLISASSQVLVKNCFARNGRHHYVSNGTSSVSGCVFLNCLSDAAYAASEGHRRWSMGLLFDNLEEVNLRDPDRILLGLYNRGDYGTAHGWSSAHSVAWNCDMGGAQLIVQKPPTAQNYAVACQGRIGTTHRFPGAPGYIEGTNQTEVLPASLYEAQLTARLAGLAEVVMDTALTRIRTDAGPSNWDMYPNPSSGTLYLTAPEAGPFRGQVLDMQGREVAAFEGDHAVEIRLHHLPPSCYLIRIRQRQAVQLLRWIKR